ncbi:MAG TPA: histidine kinase [Candidatus Avoscillospira avicola]|uniref:Histidine kinase n=1 Tax=Candidatus Avoscillospira avicola TaxID=2840706 RepID=A0A9D1AQH8_9FIRM|nr:histidine kinase [Candidatus Avoscillospira avicola]
MKEKSFLHTLNLMMRILLCLIAAVMVVFILASYNGAVGQQKIELQNYAEIYRSQIEGKISQATALLSELVYDNPDLDLLRSEQEAERQYAAVSLFNDMYSLMSVNQCPDYLVAVEADQNTIVAVKGSSVSLQEDEAIKAFALECAQKGDIFWTWDVVPIEGKIFLYRALTKESRVVMTLLSTDTLLGTVPVENLEYNSFFLADAAGNILDSVGVLAEERVGDTVEDLRAAHTLHQAELLSGELSLYACQNKLGFFQQMSSYVVVLFLIILSLLAFGLYYSKRVRVELLQPMEQMTREMEHIQQGQLDLRISTESDSVEFRTLVDAFNRLVDEIVNLKIQYYEKQLALLDTEQKYIRLQIKPHFFLNAMSTIVGLSRVGKNDEIATYIGALSKNIRYMFSSGLHTVPLQEEIRHVENYFAVQELRYPDGVLYFVDMDDEVRDWPVPQMLIHTLVENEYKYAVSPGRQTMVLIKLQKAQWQGEEMLLIQVEDDGKGFPAAVLASINGDEAAPAGDGTRVGLYSIRRLLELMYDRKGLFVLSNVEPHGAMNQVYIPAHPVNETKHDTIQEADIR